MIEAIIKLPDFPFKDLTPRPCATRQQKRHQGVDSHAVSGFIDRCWGKSMTIYQPKANYNALNLFVSEFYD